VLKKESELLVEVAHAWGSHHFRARAISVKSSLSLIISDKDIMSHLRVRARMRACASHAAAAAGEQI
jgi:hypothetical protein